jgi:hypothetical protein
MNDVKLLADLVQGVLIQLPILIVAFVGAIITLNRWRDAPAAGVWSLLGFGAAILLCLLVPASQMGVRYWLAHNSGNPSGLATAYTALAVVWSLLRAVSYVFLLVAIFAGRPRSA